MIGMVIVTHGKLALELRRATEHVVGPQERMETVCIGPDDNMERRRDDIRKAVANANAKNGVIILTDMFGGTPSNLAISLLDENNVEVLAGVNLPMLINSVHLQKGVLPEGCGNQPGNLPGSFPGSPPERPRTFPKPGNAVATCPLVT